MTRALIWALICTPIILRWYFDATEHGLICNLLSQRLVFLDVTFGREETISAVLMKLSADQLVFSPFLLAMFLIYIGAFRAATSSYRFSETAQVIKKELLPMQISGMFFWVPVSLSLFTVVPDHLKIFVINIAGLFYNTMLALKISSQDTKKKD
mmetsp:Transcript_50851/g.158911  ORF Transcript_50851/g.158911 Transcript_50851/m.158911 type:complete len:154 (-) Transcript_50851:1341-1802(-)